MNFIIQKLSLLALVILSLNIAYASTITVEVDSGLGYVDSDINVGSSSGTIYKIGDGSAAFAGTNAAYSLEIQKGAARIDNASSLPSNNVTYSTNAGNICEINVASATVPKVTMNQPGYLLADYDTSLAGMGGTSAVTIAGGFYQSTAGVVTVTGNLSASSTPAVIAGASSSLVNPATGSAGSTPAGRLKVGGATSKMSGGDLTVNGVLQITSSTSAKAFPGATTIGSGGILAVDAGVTVPSTNAAGSATITDIFSNASAGGSNTAGLKFTNNSTLRLGNGARYRRPIIVGSFDR
ncbi:MAG: hypothetical protein LW696_05130 [Alphaproteobacteria bacterium]|jgi:hypothetical protein|nr:hypothetical protein [Alphaproteobacteria bacterium]